MRALFLKYLSGNLCFVEYVATNYILLALTCVAIFVVLHCLTAFFLLYLDGKTGKQPVESLPIPCSVTPTIWVSY